MHVSTIDCVNNTNLVSLLHVRCDTLGITEMVKHQLRDRKPQPVVDVSSVSIDTLVEGEAKNIGSYTGLFTRKPVVDVVTCEVSADDEPGKLLAVSCGPDEVICPKCNGKGTVGFKRDNGVCFTCCGEGKLDGELLARRRHQGYVKV